MADESDFNRNEIVNAIRMLMEENGELTREIVDVNERLTNLAASSEEIAAEADVVKGISDSVKDKLEELNHKGDV